MNQEISLVGPFSNDQQEIIQNELGRNGFTRNVQIHNQIDSVPEGAIVAVRGGGIIPGFRNDLTYVISGGRGTGNIEAIEGRQIFDCRGENAPETAAHGLAMGIQRLFIANHERPIKSSDINVGIIGAGFVGANAGLLAHRLGFNIMLTQRAGKGIPQDYSGVISEDQGKIISESDIVIIAAGGKGVITSADRMALRGKIIVNIARAEAISSEGLSFAREEGTYLTDVWEDEPKEGDPMPTSMVNMLFGIDSLPRIEGTMHQAAQQESSNIAVARRLAFILKKIIEDEGFPSFTDPRDILDTIAREKKGESVLLASLIEATDVHRVIQLKKSLLTAAGRSLGNQDYRWSKPPIITPRNSRIHDFVRIIRNEK